jgi:CcmD family protein
MTDDLKTLYLRRLPRARSRAGRLLATLVGSLGGALLVAAPAAAQEFEKVDEAARENFPATPFVAGAYAFIWLAILAYVVITARRMRRVETDLSNLRRRIDSGGGAAPR